MVLIKIDGSQMKRLERAVKEITDGVPRVLAPAINKALNSGRTTVKREIRKDYLIKAKDIPVRIRRAHRENLAGDVRLDQTMLPLAQFKISPKGVQKRKNKKIVKAQVRTRSGGKTLPHGFVAQMASSHVGVFTRKQGAPRLPIKERLTIGAPIMASQPSVGPAVNKAMGDSLAKNIDNQIVRFMDKAGGHA